MGPDYSYLMYQAERTKTVAELRADDVRIGELAAALAQLGCAMAWPVRATHRLLVREQPAVHSPATETGLHHHGPKYRPHADTDQDVGRAQIPSLVCNGVHR